MEVALELTPVSLVQAARDGDADAFARLVAPELAPALGAAVLVIGSRADAADAVQEALVSAWRGLGGLREPDAFPAWFRRHVVRAAMRLAKRQRAWQPLEDADAAMSQLGGLESALAHRQLDRAFGTLTPADRLLLTLHFHWNQPVAETAATLGIPTGTVKSRVHHAVRRLRAAYDAEERA
ncbi:MAG TPA: sigma-70 family RNA polymerase sigma factor [Candidatus Limnocylindria bacterium]|nr:sigma-70 family RNA polymerase sigma factor [Candidatus Limnocylindria bacterium]